MKKNKDENNISVKSGSKKISKKLSNAADSVGVNPNCTACTKPVYAMERIKAERKIWHKECFRCRECNKQLTVETYQSNHTTLYCKQHFKILFAPKAVEDDEESNTLQHHHRPTTATAPKPPSPHHHHPITTAITSILPASTTTRHHYSTSPPSHDDRTATTIPPSAAHDHHHRNPSPLAPPHDHPPTSTTTTRKSALRWWSNAPRGALSTLWARKMLPGPLGVLSENWTLSRLFVATT